MIPRSLNIGRGVFMLWAVIFGPTFAEMRDPGLLAPAVRADAREARSRPLDPLNLWNLSWKADGAVPFTVLPEALTGVRAPIVVLSGRHFPTGSHKVGPAYSILVEKQLDGACAPGEQTLVFPSTGNFGIGGAWVGPRMGYRSLVVLPAEMSAERFEKIRGYGAEVIATPGCESNVKEIYDKVRELRARPENRILNQFEELGNYRFHFHCTAQAAQEVVDGLSLEVGAFVSAMGSAGTIAAGEALRQRHPGMPIVALEPVQCPTLYDVGFGGHRIEGIGDKHVTWIHNVRAIDLLLCIDDLECLEGLQLLQEGTATLAAEGVEPALAHSWVGFFGVSGVCNVLGAIRAARHYGFGPRQAVVTVATDGFDRYPSVLRRLDAEQGRMDGERARRRLEIFRSRASRFLMEGTPETRRRWHNQKYFTWVEQQGRSVEELRAQEAPDYWVAQQERAHEIDRRIRERRA
jgi:cysteine synthase A